MATEPQSAKWIELNLPLSPYGYAVLHIRPPLTELEWQRMLAILDAMKPGIVPVGANQNGEGDAGS